MKRLDAALVYGLWIVALSLLAVATLTATTDGQSWRYQHVVPGIGFRDLFWGSGSYIAPDRVRTAHHVVSWTGRVFANGEEALVVCGDSSTDSAILEVPYLENRQYLRPSMRRLSYDEWVTLAGWPQGTYLEDRATVVAIREGVLVLSTQTVVGPAYVFRIGFTRDPRGMSGGPVIDRGGYQVATIFAYGESPDRAIRVLFGVPLWGSGCR